MIYKSSQLQDIWKYANSLGYRVEVGGYVTAKGDYVITVEGDDKEATLQLDYRLLTTSRSEAKKKMQKRTSKTQSFVAIRRS